ncbi:MAG: helix-turn-helix transcriptional regulator [Ruminococcus sp.]|nr:helix-turn-helix transcriptional regulator [Ruminococcus sp.]
MIGERLQELRKDRGISQAEIAKILGVSHYTVSSYECNRSDPDDSLKVLLARFFDVSVDYLLGLTDEPYSYQRDKNIIRIPQDFQEADIESVKDFIRFIRYKKSIGMK